MRLFLVRHGQTVWNVSNKAQGHCDVPLDEVGTQQAHLLAGRLQHEKIDRILSSDLTRCRQTIGPYCAVSGLDPIWREDLRERTFGSMEGENYSDLHKWMSAEASRLGLKDWEIKPPNGESMSDVWDRLATVEAEIRSSSENVLIVSHGGALAQLLAKIIQGTHETPRAFRFNNCGVTTLERRPDGSFMLSDFNNVSHLKDTNERS